VQAFGDPIVFPHPDGVHDREADLLVDAEVAGEEAVDGALGEVAPAVDELAVGVRQEGLPTGEGRALPKQAQIAPKVPELPGGFVVVAVDLRGVQVARQLVELLARCQLPHEDASHSRTCRAKASFFVASLSAKRSLSAFSHGIFNIGCLGPRSSL
jgi:hypothetical protein